MQYSPVMATLSPAAQKVKELHELAEVPSGHRCPGRRRRPHPHPHPHPILGDTPIGMLADKPLSDVVQSIAQDADTKVAATKFADKKEK